MLILRSPSVLVKSSWYLTGFQTHFTTLTNKHIEKEMHAYYHTAKQSTRHQHQACSGTLKTNHLVSYKINTMVYCSLAFWKCAHLLIKTTNGLSRAFCNRLIIHCFIGCIPAILWMRKFFQQPFWIMFKVLSENSC